MKSEELFKELAFLAGKPSLKNAVETRASSRPSTTLTEDELCRQAILRVGTAEQFGPSSQAMLLAKSLYPQVRDALLLAGSWTWAMKSGTVIETLPRPEYKWSYRYAIPADCLRVFRVNDYDYSTGDSSWEVAGNFVLSNVDSGSPAWVVDRSYEVGNAVSNNGVVYRCLVAGTIKQPGSTAGWTSDWDVWLGKAITLEYVRKVTDVTLFDSMFIDLLTANLASKLAIPLTGDSNKAILLAKDSDSLAKSPAMRRDSTERKGRIKPAWMSSKLVSSRNGGDGIEAAAQSSGGGPAGGVSYPALLVTVGTVTNLPSGSTPTVTNTGAADTAVLNFGLPQGPIGTPNTLAIGSVAPGVVASASITGTAPNQTLNLVLPQASLISNTKTRLTGDGVTKTFLINGLKSSDPNHVIVAINGVLQEPTIDYLVNQGAGTITFAVSIPNKAKIVVIALGLYSPSTQRDPDLYIHSFGINAAGTFSYYGVMLNSFIPATGSSADVAMWEITRSALTSSGEISSTAKAINVAWTNRETATYA